MNSVSKRNFSQILEITRERISSSATTSLVIEGGGLRGVVSATMLDLISTSDPGLKFDKVYGTSAGAINGAYYLDNKTSDCLQLYRDMASTHFVEFWKWPNAMNMNYLFEDRIRNHYPLSWENICSRQSQLYISATDAETGRGYFFSARQAHSQKEFLSFLRASSSAPLFTPNKEYIQGKYYCDGQVEYSIPVQKALDDGSDYILCLLTRPRGYRKKAGGLDSFLSSIALRKDSEKFKKQYSGIPERYNRDLVIIENGQPKIEFLCLEPEDYFVSKMALNPKYVDKCIESVRKRFLT